MSDKKFIKNWMDKHGKIKQGRIADSYIKYSHKKWDENLAIPVNELDNEFEKIRNFIESQN